MDGNDVKHSGHGRGGRGPYSRRDSGKSPVYRPVGDRERPSSAETTHTNEQSEPKFSSSLRRDLAKKEVSSSNTKRNDNPNHRRDRSSSPRRRGSGDQRDSQSSQLRAVSSSSTTSSGRKVTILHESKAEREPSAVDEPKRTFKSSLRTEAPKQSRLESSLQSRHVVEDDTSVRRPFVSSLKTSIASKSSQDARFCDKDPLHPSSASPQQPSPITINREGIRHTESDSYNQKVVSNSKLSPQAKAFTSKLWPPPIQSATSNAPKTAREEPPVRLLRDRINRTGSAPLRQSDRGWSQGWEPHGERRYMDRPRKSVDEKDCRGGSKYQGKDRNVSEMRMARSVSDTTSDHPSGPPKTSPTLIKGSSATDINSGFKRPIDTVSSDITRGFKSLSSGVSTKVGVGASPSSAKPTLSTASAMQKTNATEGSSKPLRYEPRGASLAQLEEQSSLDSTPPTSGESSLSKEERTRVFLAKHDADNKALEAASRAKNPFVSSLKSSMAPPSAQESAAPKTSNILSRVGDRVQPSVVIRSNAEERTRGIEDMTRETARRFGSSLQMNRPTPILDGTRRPIPSYQSGGSGIAGMRLSQATYQSSLQASMRAPLTRSLKTNKKVYTIMQLRKLRLKAKEPSNADRLRNMTVMNVEQVRPYPGKSGATKPMTKAVASVARLGRVVTSRGSGGAHISSDVKGTGKTSAPSRGKNVSRNERRKGRGSRNERSRNARNPPPIYDGPIEPLQVTENRWIPKKAAFSPVDSASTLAVALSRVKGVLNKLTREKFAKLTAELCSTEMETLEMLQSIISIIMDKALEEPNFADVYADLCKEFHTRTCTTVWRFLRTVEYTQQRGVFFWTTVRKDDTSGFLGPLKSIDECLNATGNSTPTDSTRTTQQNISSAKLFTTGEHLVAIVEASKGSFYYRKRAIADLAIDEPVLGQFESEQSAIEAGMKQTSFKRLLVTRCQDKFGQLNKPIESTSEPMDKRQRDLLASREKRLMLGNIRFIGELFKASLLHQNVVQTCIFYLLGLELVKGGSVGSSEMAGREIRLPTEEDIEALCKLLATVGKKYDQPQTQPIMKIVIFRLVQLSEEKTLPSRARFLVKDLLETRDHQWVPRRNEMQQKTLEQVRQEAKQLQMQGKNAQHDNLNSRRLKSQVSSAQLIKQSGASLLIAKETPSEPESLPISQLSIVEGISPSQPDVDVSKVRSRMKNIIQEYVSVVDLNEAVICVRELPSDLHTEFAEEILNRALEGKDDEREHVVTLLVSLYDAGALTATTIQAALLSVLEFLEDIQIDVPRVHEYTGLIFGRLIASGCFDLEWMIKTALAPMIECGLASLVFAEALVAIEEDSDEATVVRMVEHQEIDPATVLPHGTDSEQVTKYLTEHGLDIYFGGHSDDEGGDDNEMEYDSDQHEDDELHPDIQKRIESTLREYLSVKDLDEVTLCINELFTATTKPWGQFVRVCVTIGIDAKQSIRIEISELFVQLQARDDATTMEDYHWAFEMILSDYEDLRVDAPKIGDNLSEMWTPLFYATNGLTLDWLHHATSHLRESGYAAEVLSSLLGRIKTLYGQTQLMEWWQKQLDHEVWLYLFSDSEDTVRDCLKPWQQQLI